MALPGLDFSDFKEGRAPASSVAKYYLEYIEKNKLSANFAPNTTVTMVQPLSSKVSYFFSVLVARKVFSETRCRESQITNSPF